MSSSPTTTSTTTIRSVIASTTTLIAVVSTSLLLYTQWKNLPKWMRFSTNSSVKKDDETTRGGTPTDDEEDDVNEHLNSIPAILDKLSHMMSQVQKIDSTPHKDLDEIDFIASLYSLLHLYTEIETKDPDYREKLYHNVGENDDVKLNEVQELVEYLDYAHWAYQKSPLEDNIKKAGLDLISQDITTEAGRVGHFVACKHSEKIVIIALKGTSTFSDVLTDLIANPLEHFFDCFDDNDNNNKKDNDSNDKATTNMYCHEGIFTAAIWMADHVQSMLENLFVPLNYKVVICGHSLGAGTACLLGLELRSRIKAYQNNYTDLRVLAYATPPVLSYKASLACAPFVTSCVNNSDVICRCSIANLVVMEKLLTKVHDRLVEKGMTVGDSWKSLKKYYEEHSTIDDDLLLSEDELDQFFDETHGVEPDKESPQSLFVPGRVVALWDKGENDDHEMGGIVTNGGMRMLRQIEFRSTMITDHLVNTGYKPNLHKLLEQLENTI